LDSKDLRAQLYRIHLKQKAVIGKKNRCARRPIDSEKPMRTMKTTQAKTGLVDSLIVIEGIAPTGCCELRESVIAATVANCIPHLTPSFNSLVNVDLANSKHILSRFGYSAAAAPLRAKL
jgi:hypothetical protein